MAEKPANLKGPESDELDIGQLFKLIGKGIHRLFRAFLRIFIYLKKRLLILIILALVGFGIGYGLRKVITTKQKIEVIVKPNLESKNYLYDVVEEVQANIEAKDTLFFKTLGIALPDLKGYEIEIVPVEAREAQAKDQMEYLELLQKFENTGIVSDVLRAEILNKSSLNHRITFYYTDYTKGPEFARKVMDYINSNAFFDDLVKINKENAEVRIKENSELMAQIDLIIQNYSDQMARNDVASGEGRIVLDNEEKVNITGLFDLKNALIRDTEQKKLELLEQNQAISIINFGKPQKIKRSFFGKKIVLMPTLLILFYFLVDFVKYLNRKSLEIEQE